MRGGGAYLFANENNTALEVKNQKILLQIKELQAEFESEDSLKKRNQLQEKIDTLKKQYTENAMLQNQNPSNTEKISLIQKKQTGVFLAISAGIFGQSRSIWSDIKGSYYGGAYSSGYNLSLAALLKLGYQKMWNDYLGTRAYLSVGGIPRDFSIRGADLSGGIVSAGVDMLVQIPFRKVAWGVYAGIGGGFFASDYSLLGYFHPDIVGVLSVPFGISLAFGHSRFELGGLTMLGSLDDFGKAMRYVRTTYKLTMIGATLSYQYTF